MEPELDWAAKLGREGLTFDDVLLLPAESSVLPNDVATGTRLTRTIALEIPIVSARLELMARYRISGVPITDEAGVLVGILTNRDLRFEGDAGGRPVSALMTIRNLVTPPVGTTLAEAEEILHRPKLAKRP